jgi:uncharacterized membrane protein YvlD (DUF360 family)
MLLLLIIIGWSITNIIVNGSIFDEIRIYLMVKNQMFSKLLTCMQCSGFWVGIGLGIFSVLDHIVNPFYSLLNPDSVLYFPLTILACGFFNSGISVIINSVIVFLLNSFSSKINRDGEI